MTERLYESDPYLKEFKAEVLSNDDGSIILDRTAFFPKGGGQEAEGGYINEFEVTDVTIKDDIIYHKCDSNLKPGDKVHCKINFLKRYDNMQQHTGEHILSGVVQQRFGFSNVGFHIADLSMRVDYNGYISDDELKNIEKEANDIIRRNIAVYQGYPEENDDRLKGFRFKKDIAGDIRIVDIGGVDCCACCGTHMRSTAEVGIIKIVSSSKYKSGVRLNVLCGDRALDYYNFLLSQADSISNITSSSVNELESGVKKLYEKKLELEKREGELLNDLIRYKCIELEKKNQDYIIAFESIDNKSLKKMSVLLREMSDKDIFIFSENEGRIKYIFSSKNNDMKSFNEEFKKEFDAKGGGSASSVSGSVSGKKEDIITWLEKKVLG